MKIKTAELSEEQLKKVFSAWFETAWRQDLKDTETPAMRQRQYMIMAWSGFKAAHQLSDEVDIPDELMESQ
ncbi:hypothetical protein KXR87_13045 [Yokenella regensburgei]|uniref:hypothetical protein n=1 Tax=Yokenella regensburgei TaxID=158877 RepID=UPI003F14DED8